MRRLLLAILPVLLPVVANAQHPLEQIVQVSIIRCLGQHAGRRDAQDYCRCWVQKWFALWDEADKAAWARNAETTPHAHEMEAAAAAACGGK